MAGVELSNEIARCWLEIWRIRDEEPVYPAWLLAMAEGDWQAELDRIMAEMHSFASGAKSTEVKPRYDLVPVEAVRYIAERFAFGASRHGEHNWKNGVTDAEFIRDRKNHAAEHLMAYLAGETKTDATGATDTPIDHLKAALCNLAMLAWIEEHQQG